MRKTNKRGFTIVELVIVIAVIAILAAVLIPTFSNLVKKANVTSDTQLIRNLNTALAVDNQEHPTMQSALDAAALAGYDVERINASATGNEILWDSKNDLFCYLTASGIDYIPESNMTDNKRPTEKVAYWRITDDASLAVSGPYSVYYTGDAPADGKVTTSVGFDAGTKTGITEVTYTSNAGQDVIIRTNGGALTVSASTDDVKHYGWVENLTITAVRSDHCYHEFGFVGNFDSFGTGKFIAESTAEFHQTQLEIEAVLSGKTYDLDNGEKYGQHHYIAGQCVSCDKKENNENEIKYTPKIKIIKNSDQSYSLAMDENSVDGAQWNSYEIILRIPFYIADYITADNDTTFEGYEFLDYADAQCTKSIYIKNDSISDRYVIDLTYTVRKETNAPVIPYSKATALFWNGDIWNLWNDGETTDVYVTTPTGKVQVSNVRTSSWGTEEGTYYTVQYSAFEGMDIVDGIYGSNAHTTKIIYQCEDEVPTYIINLYDEQNSIIGTNEYPPILSLISDYLDEYINNYEKWVSDNSKENTRATLIDYHNTIQNFKTDQVEFEELTNEMGVGDSGSEIMRSIVTSVFSAQTSTFDFYTIKVSGDDNNSAYKFSYIPISNE